MSFFVSFSALKKSSLFDNMASLGVMQLANYILPLVSIPYLVRVLGIEFYGLLAVATASVSYFALISDYGFNLSATRSIAVARADKYGVSKIFWAVYLVQLTMSFVSIILLYILSRIFLHVEQHLDLYFAALAVVLFRVLFPTWLFQGMERMRFVALVNVFARLFFLGAIFIFVRTRDDLVLVPTINATGLLFVVLFSLYFSVRKLGILFVFPSFSITKEQIVGGWHVFLSRAGVNLYSSTNTVILGAMVGVNVVGVYTIAEQCISAIKGLSSPVIQALFPYLTKIHARNKRDFFAKSEEALKIIVAVFLIISLTTLLCSDMIVFLVSGQWEKDSAAVLSVLSVSVVLSVIGSFYSNKLIILKRGDVLSKAVFVAAFINFLLVIPSIFYFNIIGMAVTVVMVQLLIVCILYSYFKLALIDHD